MRAARWIVVLAACASAGCVGVSGELRSTGGALGDHHWTAIGCTSGAAHGFVGADVRANARDVVASVNVRAISDVVSGQRVRISSPESLERFVELTPASCPTLRVDAEPAGWGLLGTPAIDGKIAFDCALPDGGRVSGQINYYGCTRYWRKFTD
jgi:hypothetical protein